MKMTLATVQQKIANYLKNELSLSDFRDWSFDCMMAENIIYDSVEHDLTSRIITLIDDESLEENIFRVHLSNILSILEENTSYEVKKLKVLNILNKLQKS